MPADPKYGSANVGFADAIARMRDQQVAIDALEAKEAELQRVEEEATGATRSNISVRLDAAAAIERQTAASSVLIDTLGREIEILSANTEAWRANAIARGSAAGESEGLAAGAAAGVGRRAKPYVAPVGGANDIAATRAEADASIADLDAKLAAMQAAQMAAAQNVLRTSTLAVPAEQAALPSGERRLLGAGPVYSGGAGTYLGQGGAVRLGEQAKAGAFVAGSGGLAREATRTSTIGEADGTFSTTAIGEYSAAEERLIAINEATAASVAGVGAAQLEANTAFSLSVAEVSASSRALALNAGINREMISAFAAGEVSIGEFGTALEASIGKFAPWAAAAVAAFGIYEGGKKILEGAIAGASGATQLERAIPNIDRQAALEGFREVSQRLNVSPHEVAEAQFYTARAGFHSQGESLKAAETTLLAHKLDEVPIQEAAKGLGALHIAFGLNADAIHQVFNELDVGQLKFNARLNQTLPQMGRAASAFANAGGTAQQLASQLVEVVGATGGGGGQGGGNPATFLLREAASNLVRPSAEKIIREYGYDPKKAAQDVGKFNEELQNRAAIKPGQPGYLTPEDKAELARAIGGGGAQGGRYGIALLNAGTSGRAAEVREGLAKAGDSSAEDLEHKKAQLNEQLASVGYAFERLGLELGTGGATRAAEDFLGVVKLLAEGLEKAAKPLGGVGHALGAIPGPVQDAGLVLGGAALLSKFGRSSPAERAAEEATKYAQQQVVTASVRNQSAQYAVSTAVAEKARWAAGPEGQELLATSPNDFGERAEELRAKSAQYDDALAKVQGRAQVSNVQLLAAQDVAGGKLGVGGAAEAASVEATEGGVALGDSLDTAAVQAKVAGVAYADTLDANAVQTKAAALTVSEGLNAAALQIREGGAEVFLAFKTLLAEGALGLGAAGTKAVIGEGAAGLGGVVSGGAAGSAALFTGMAKKLMPAFFTAYLGAMASELIGSKLIGGSAGKIVGGIGTDVAVGAGVGTLFGSPEIGAGIGGAYGVISAITKSEESARARERAPLKDPLVSLRRFSEGSGTSAKAQLKKLEDEAEHAGEATWNKDDQVQAPQAADKVKKKIELQIAILKKQQEAGGKILTASETGQEKLLNQAEGWAQERETAQGTGEAAQHAHANVEKREKVLQARAKLFGASSPAGRQVQEEIRAEAGATLGDITKNPANVDEYAQEFEKALEASTKPAQAQLTRQLKHAKTPDEALKYAGEFQQVVSANETIVPDRIKQQTAAITAAQKEAKELEEAIAKLKTEGSAGASKMLDVKKALEEERKKIKSLGDGLKTLNELAPRIQAELKELGEGGAEAGLAAADKINKTHSALKVAEAGANTGDLRKAEQEREETNTREGKRFLKNYPGPLKLREEEQKKEKVEREHKEKVEGAEKIETNSALKVAELPITATKGQQAELKAKGAKELEEYVKKNAKSNAFGWKQIADAEKAADEAKKAAEEAVNQEEQSLTGLRGQIAQASEQGNAVAQAGTALSTAQKMMSLAKNEEQRLHATLEMVTAHNQLAQAQQSLASSQGELAKTLAKGGAPGEAKVEIATDKKLLALAQGPEEKNKAEAALNTAKKSWTSALVTEREREIAFHEEMKEISKQQALLQLEDLEKIGGKSQQAEQELKSKIRQLEKGSNNNQVFSLAPGSIKLPTALDVQRAAGEAVMRSFSGSTASGLPRVAGITNQQYTITINVKDSHDVPKVGEELERITGGAMNTRLRKAGYRGN
jgi:hypothetical protein